MSTGLVQTGSSDENATIMINKNGKPKPLQASTNIIHTKTPRRIDNVIHVNSRQLPGKKLNEPLKKKQASSSKVKSDLKASKTSKTRENDVKHLQTGSHKKTITTPVKKVDENDVSAMIKNAYDPLNDVCPLDEDLFQKVMKLEYADDGIPAFDYSEPFDF